HACVQDDRLPNGALGSSPRDSCGTFLPGSRAGRARLPPRGFRRGWLSDRRKLSGSQYRPLRAVVGASPVKPHTECGANPGGRAPTGGTPPPPPHRSPFPLSQACCSPDRGVPQAAPRHLLHFVVVVVSPVQPRFARSPRCPMPLPVQEPGGPCHVCRRSRWPLPSS